MCGGGTFGRVVRGVVTGGLSEVSRATGLPLDAVSLGESVVDQLKPPEEPVLQPAPEPPKTKDLREPNSSLFNELRRRRRGASGALPNLGNTLLTGPGGIPDSEFINTRVRSLLGGR